MSRVKYCGERTCNNNYQGKCNKRKIGINENGVCMGYSPLFVPNTIGMDNNTTAPNQQSLGADSLKGFDGDKTIQGFC